MKAIVIEQTGGPEVLALQDVPDPDVSEGQSLLRVRAAGVNFLDLLVRQGNYAQAPELPTIPGAEAAGETEDGRRVMALLTGGGYAEQVAVDTERLIPLPEGASFAEGASFLLTFLTAWIPLTRQVRLEPGQTVLVHAGSGGVGTASIQCARHLGARVVATASTEEKRQFCLEQGAEEAFGYDEFAEAVRPGCRHGPGWRRPLRGERRHPLAARHARLHRLRRRLVAGDEPGPARREERWRSRLLSRPADGETTRCGGRCGGRAARGLALRLDQAGGRRGVSARAALRTPTS